MSTKKFKSESKQILDLMINSIYSNKESFLRELISNSSDALDKRRIKSFNDDTYKFDELKIEIICDEKNRKLTIKDNGIGMSKNEVIENLGTIAHSGSAEFLKTIDKDTNEDIIGKFGVGFYSSFIVGSKVEVFTKNNKEIGIYWFSEGKDNYSIQENDKKDIGTDVVVTIKNDPEYDRFLQIDEIKQIIKKYSNYIKYPIYVKNIDENSNKDLKPANEQTAIWKKDKKQVKQEEYDNFYMSEFNDFQAPLLTIKLKAEGILSYESLLFIPKSKKINVYTKENSCGLSLYTKGVLIEKDCKELLSPSFRFVKGIVDTEDLSLNISREMLQKDIHVKKIQTNLENKIKKELLKLLKNDRSKYEEFYKEYGSQLMYSIYENFGSNIDLLKDLLMFKSNKHKDSYITLSEYIKNMQDKQENIFYVTGSNIKTIETLPQLEKFTTKNIDVLYFTNEVDEFAINIIREYDGKKFLSIASENNLIDEEEKKDLEEKTKNFKSLLEDIKKNLENKVSDVKLTNSLKNSPFCLVSSKDGISLGMEKILKANNSAHMETKKILELNPNHKLFNTLKDVRESDINKFNDYVNIIYTQALLLEGFNIDDPVEYNNLIIKNIIDKNI